MSRGLLQTALLGATGYSGCELAKLLLRHPRLKPPLLLARESGEAGPLLPELVGAGNGTGPLALEPFSWKRLHARGVDLLFLATPHEVSHALVPEAIRRGLRVIDLSGAWRLRRPEHRAAYGLNGQRPEDAALLAQAVYGLPDLAGGRLVDAALVSNPGCYPTSVILALAPLVEAGAIDLARGVVCDCKSGVSGAGKRPTPETHFVEVAENFRAYALFQHRHTGEILEQLGLEPAQLLFSTHLLPLPRGILSTMYVHLRRPHASAEVEELLRRFYAGRPFVRVFAPPRLPEIQFAARTNFCDLGFALDPAGQRLILVSCLDNLLKGAAGQAVENMNLMYGWPQAEGLA